MRAVDHTHDPSLESWVDTSGTDFPIQNLPFGVFRRTGDPRIGIAIGDQILDLRAVAESRLLGDVPDEILGACLSRSLNRMMSLGSDASALVRRRVSALLSRDSSDRERVAECLLPVSEADLLVPARIGDYTDFYASIDHATNVGSMFRPDNPLLPNYRWIPIGYHGRSSSIVASGSPIRRPSGQVRPDPEAPPRLAQSSRLDYELEIGAYIARGNPLGSSLSLGEAEEYLFGICLVNDWSARDIQSWEYQPLGPFLAKSFATSVSPWIVTMEALAPFRLPSAPRGENDPEPLPHLDAASNREQGGIDLQLEVLVASARMRDEKIEPVRLSRGDFSRMYWTLAQMVTHHASNGCNLRPGDLIASGTVSGPEKSSRGCLLELTWGGRDPLELPTGETRRFLEDGDEVILRGWCERDGAARIGLGECRGTVLPALNPGKG